jgi:integrase
LHATQRAETSNVGQQTALRHGFASYHLATFQDAPATALQLGHTNTAMLYGHYREVVTPETAQAYWSILP